MGAGMEISDRARRLVPVAAALVAAAEQYLLYGYSIPYGPTIAIVATLSSAVGGYQVVDYLLYRARVDGDNSVGWRDFDANAEGLHRGASGLILLLYLPGMLVYQPVWFVEPPLEQLLASAVLAVVSVPLVYWLLRRVLPPDDEAESAPKLTDSNPV